MNKKNSRVQIDNGKTRYRFVIEDDPSTPGWAAQIKLPVFLRWLGETPDLLSCGPDAPDTLIIKHNGKSWIAEGEVVVRDQQTY